MRKIKVSPEYGVSPIWIQSVDGIFEDVSIEDAELLFSDEMKYKIIEWDNLFQKTFNQDYPPDSNFKDENERQYFEESGKLLFEEIKKHLSGRFEVIYETLW